MKAPILHTSRLIIRPLHILDAKHMFRYRADSRVTRYQSWHPMSEQEVKAFIETYSYQEFPCSNSWFQMGAYLQQNGELIGDIGIHFFDENNRLVELGYTIAPVYQQKGYAGEAVKTVLAYLFETLHITCAAAQVDAENAASAALLLKLGFVRAAQNSFAPFIEEQVDDLYVLERCD